MMMMKISSTTGRNCCRNRTGSGWKTGRNKLHDKTDYSSSWNWTNTATRRTTVRNCCSCNNSGRPCLNGITCSNNHKQLDPAIFFSPRSDKTNGELLLQIFWRKKTGSLTGREKYLEIQCWRLTNTVDPAGPFSR